MKKVAEKEVTEKTVMDLDLAAIDGPYPEFARQVRLALTRNRFGGRLSTRQVCRKLGMSHVTITGMTTGHRPSRSIVIEFAEGIGLSVNDLLEAAGYPLLGDKPAQENKGAS